MAEINGVVTIGKSSTPGEATVLLFNEAGDTIVASTTSDPVTGEYSFDGLAEGITYRVAVMGNGVYRSRVYGPCIVADPHWANVVSLLHFNGADGSTTFTDERGKVWTPHGNAQIDTAQSKFGGASGLFDGAGDYLSTPNHSDFNLATGSFTIESWIRPFSVGSMRAIASQRNSAGTSGYVFWVRDTQKLGFVFSNGSGSWVDAVGATNIVANSWTHVAASFDGSAVRLFVNGALDAEATSFSGLRATAANEAYIGRDREGNTTRDWIGHLDDLRITKGIARYTANFTPPAAPFPNT